METLVVVAQHRDQYNGGKSKHHGTDDFVSSPSQSFKGINCRSYQFGVGLLPTPLKSCCTPLTKQDPCHSSNSPGNLHSKSASKSAPIAINIKASRRGRSFNCGETFAYSELWAGPAYSNSPPPSSLPIPKFSMRPKRTVSLELPAHDCDVKVHPIAKSAPTSPTTREHGHFTREVFHNADSATQTLRRILNLDISDE